MSCANWPAEALAIIRQVPGAADTAIEQEADQAQLRIRIDRQAVARYGINVRDVQDVIEMAIGGRAAGTMFEGERRFDITVRYIPEARTDVARHRQHAGADARRRARAAVAVGGDQSRQRRHASSRGERTSGRSLCALTSVDGTRGALSRRRRSDSAMAMQASRRL